MATSVCMVCCEESTTNTNRKVNVSKLVKSPELTLVNHNVPAQGFDASEFNKQLPVADFYLNCLPDKLSNQALESPEESKGPRLEGGRFVRLLAGQSRSQNEIPQGLINDLRKELQDSGNQLRLDALRKRPSESRYGEQTQFSVLAFGSAGLSSLLTLMEHDISPGHISDIGYPQSERVVVITDPICTESFQGVINSIIKRPHFVGLNGCFRVDISFSSVTATITDISIDLKPRIFHHRESLDDWMVSQVPGGHEALLCLLLTHHQQKSKGLTAKQATVRAAFDAISPGLAATFDCIAHVAVMRSLAFQFSWEGTVLDVGCGQGVFGGLLNTYHKGVVLYGTDMSEAMIKAPQIEQYYRSPIHIGPMEQTLMSSPTTDHVTCFSVFQYVTPMTFIAALSQMFLKARRSITFDIPEVDAEYARKLNATAKLWRPSDHLSSLERIGTPAGWKLAMHRHCLTYTEPNYEHDVYSRYIRYERLG